MNSEFGPACAALKTCSERQCDGDTHGEEECGEDHIGQRRAVPRRMQQGRIDSRVGSGVGHQDHAGHREATQDIEGN